MNKLFKYFILLFVLMGSQESFSQKSLEEGKTKTLFYQCNFDSQTALDDWVMEGPGIAKINKGRLELYSRYHKKVYRKIKKGEIVFEEGTNKWYQNYTDGLALKAEPHMYPSYKLGDTFRGGHLVYWNKIITPENYVIEFDFQSPIPFPLHMIMFSATGTKGENVFHPSLKKRCGVAAQYTKGDIYNYRISFLAPKRGTANMRKCPGRRLVTKGPDLTLKNLTGKHHMKVIKWKDQIEFRIDGQLIFQYHDKESDAALGAGQTAIRLMVPARGYYDNYQIFELK
ncbi:DUF1961 domain-containing protein [Marinifilum breve]|uniref:DUF1961 domain-containing protein n=1 Tax=Marinifilum breve TaxID=2184082 RepID=A0A2V4ACE9_9BACT|nr:DUF1961 family protein [Marinifilum breve]PXY01694.1 DUF1961 domain-containing protein [Marinifilum breve]